MKLAYPTTSTNDACGDERISNPYVSLPINYPMPLWPINHPTLQGPISYRTLAWPYNYSSSGPLWHPTSTFGQVPSDTIRGYTPNQVVSPWPLYTEKEAPFSYDRMPASRLDLTVDTARNQSSQLDKMPGQSHKIDLPLDKPSDDRLEQAKSDSATSDHDLIVSVLSEKIVKQNIVTNVNVTEDTITVYISPVITRHACVA